MTHFLGSYGVPIFRKFFSLFFKRKLTTGNYRLPNALLKKETTWGKRKQHWEKGFTPQKPSGRLHYKGAKSQEERN
jgi:hypothetical protein